MILTKFRTGPTTTLFTYLYGILNSYIILQYLHGIHIFVWNIKQLHNTAHGIHIFVWNIKQQYLHGIHIFVWNIKQLHNTAVFTWYSHICMEY